MFLLGLTGGIAAGKSTVAEHLMRSGIPVIDADSISREMTKKGAIGSEAIRRTFGEGFFRDGELDRKALGRFVFSSKENTKKLEEVLHPLILREIDERVAEFARREELLVVLDAPLLIESGLHTLCDGVLLITADEEIRLKRAMTRGGLTREEARRRMQRQMPEDEKKKYADHMIDNSGELGKTLAEAEAYVRQLAGEREEI